ncbi:kinase-like domain-containing protein [Mycena capillaripes]|nr:kinase-like domain-containing protein [Mycena capillaripes]
MDQNAHHPVHIKYGDPLSLAEERAILSWLASRGGDSLVSEPLRLAEAPHGDLQSYLWGHPDVPQQLRAKWGNQIAEGIAHVHAHNIVWADCSLTNLLVTAELDLLLCDFGGSGMHEDRTDVVPPGRYCDPNVPLTELYYSGRKLDIFAFGCVFLEILTYTARNTNGFWRPELHRGGRSFDGQKLLIDEVSFPPFKDIVEDCWDGKYSNAEQLFAAVNDAYTKFNLACERGEMAT